MEGGLPWVTEPSHPVGFTRAVGVSEAGPGAEECGEGIWRPRDRTLGPHSCLAPGRPGLARGRQGGWGCGSGPRLEAQRVAGGVSGGSPPPERSPLNPTAVPVDVLQTLGMQDGRDGVSVTAGICPQRPGTEDPDFAFRVDNRTQLSAPTRQLFPGTAPGGRGGRRAHLEVQTESLRGQTSPFRGAEPPLGVHWWGAQPDGFLPIADGSFPEDFSILATVRARRGGQAFLLSIYDERGVQQLGMEIGLSPVFLYEDQEGRPAPEQYPVFRRVNLADGR